MSKPDDSTTGDVYPYRLLPSLIGYLQLDGWAGRAQQRVRIVRYTPKRVEIEAIKDTILGGRRKTLYTDERTLVPRASVTLHAVRGVKLI